MELIQIDLNETKNLFWWVFDWFYRILEKTVIRTLRTYEGKKVAMTSKRILYLWKNPFELKKKCHLNQFFIHFYIKIDSISTG